MKKRVISAIIASIICIPFILLGGIYFKIGVYVISIIGLKEFLDVKEVKKELPYFIKFISYILLTLIIFGTSRSNILTFSINYKVLSGLFLSLLIPTVLYHDKTKYSVTDAFYLIGGLLFLGIAFSLLIIIRNDSLTTLIYLLLITIITDTYAFFTGKLIGRHKLLESISPNKTLEGLIGGTLMAVIAATSYYHVVIDPKLSIYIIVLITLFLSILGQFGDLVFSAIKRYFGKKDFSNIMPGHGGILDRLDSIIFVLLGFMFFISII